MEIMKENVMGVFFWTQCIIRTGKTAFTWCDEAGGEWDENDAAGGTVSVH